MRKIHLGEFGKFKGLLPRISEIDDFTRIGDGCTMKPH